jgi:hypothetical protein
MRKLSVVAFLLIWAIPRPFSPPALTPAGGRPTAIDPARVPNATSFYRSMAAGVSAAKGELLFKLRDGLTVTRVPGTPDIRWFVEPGTQVLVKLHYEDGPNAGWKSLSMNFGSHPLVVSLGEGRPGARRQEITSIEFRRNGEPDEYYNGREPIVRSLSDFPEIRQHLRIPNGPSSIFLGLPFAGMAASPSPDGGGLAVREVLIPAEGSRQHLTTVRLPPHTAITLMPGGQSDAAPRDFVRLSQPCDLTISSLSYKPDDSQTEGVLGPLTFVTEDGRIGASDTIFNLWSGDTLSFQAALFSSVERPGTATGVNLVGGSLSGIMRSGSRVEIARTSRGASLLSLNQYEPVSLQGLHLSFKDTLVESIKADSAVFPVTGASGEISFDDENFLKVHFQSTPSLSAGVTQAVWETDQPPSLSGSIPAFAADVLSGQVTLNTRSLLRFGSGKVTASEMILDSPSKRPARASFTGATFAITVGTRLGVADKFAIHVNGGSLDAATSASPLVFDASQSGPSGRFIFRDVSVEGGMMALGRRGAVRLTTGTIGAALARSPGSGLTGELSGVLDAGAGSLTLDSDNAYAIHDGRLRFERLQLSDAGVAGAFTSVLFSLDPSPAHFSDTLSVTTAAGATLSAADEAAHFTVTRDGLIEGICDLHLPINRGAFHMGGVASVSFNAGTVEAHTTIAQTQPLTGTLNLDASGDDGTFAVNGDTTLRIMRGRIRASGLTLRNPHVLAGTISAMNFRLVSSTLTLPNALRTDFTDGAVLDARGSSTLEITADKKLVGAYHLRLPVRKGEMKLGGVGSVQITGGVVDLFLSRAADQSQQATLNADVSIGGGALELLPGSRFSLKDGSSLKAKGLSVSDSKGVTGALVNADLALGAGVIAVPGGFVIDAKDSGRLTTAQTANPLVIPGDGAFTQGSFLLDVPFASLTNSRDVNYQLVNGRARLPLQNNADGSITGSNCSISGTLPVSFSDPEIELQVEVTITNGTLMSRPGEPAHFSAALSATIPQVPEVSIAMRADDQGRLSPAGVRLKTIAPSTVSGTMTLDGSSVSVPIIDQTFAVDLNLNLSSLLSDALAQIPPHFDESAHPEVEGLRWSFDQTSRSVGIQGGRVVVSVSYRGDIETTCSFPGCGCHLNPVFPIANLSFRPDLTKHDGQWFFAPSDVNFRIDLGQGTDTGCGFLGIVSVGDKLRGFLNGDRVRDLVVGDVQRASRPVPVDYALTRLSGRVKLNNGSGTRACFSPQIDDISIGSLSGSIDNAHVPIQIRTRSKLTLADTCSAP